MKKQFSVGGMTCSACSARVERCVKAVEGVTDCTVNLITGALSVEMSEDVSAKIMSAVVSEGYKIKEGVSLKRGREREHALKKRLIISVPLMALLMYIAMGPMTGIPVPPFLNAMIMEHMLTASIVQAVITLAVIIVNFAYFTSGFKKLFTLKPNMDSLVALGSSASFIYGIYTIIMIAIGHFTGNHELMTSFMDNLYFEGSAMILTLITVGKFLEEKSKNKTMSSVEKLLGLAPDTAVVLINGEEKEIKIAELKEGDAVVLKDGDRIPCDCIVKTGGGWIDQSAITGESIPVYKEIGDKLVTGTVFSGGYATAEAVSVGEDTTLSQIIRMVSDAAATKAPIAKVADKVSGVFVPVVIGIAIVTFVIWMLVGRPVGYSLARAISVLVISCPCALGLATPVAIMVGNGVGAKHGILFKTAVSLEETGKVQIVALDKTGTITKGEPRVTDIFPVGCEEAYLMHAAYALEQKSEHPLAKAIIAWGDANNQTEVGVREFQAVSGNGLMGVRNGKHLQGGNWNYISGQIRIEKEEETELRKQAEVYASEGKTPLFFAEDGKILGMVTVADVMKEDSPEAIAELKNMGIHVVMLTGDNEQTAQAIGKQAGVDEVIAGVLPDGKEAVIANLQKKGKVAMVGDGVNDAPALTRADMGIAIGAGTDIAIDAADVVLMKSRLLDVPAAIRLSRATLRNIHENLFWAFIYNIIGIPLAAGAWIHLFGWTLNPMFGAAAMSLSSFCVVTNALRLNLFKFGKKQRETA